VDTILEATDGVTVVELMGDTLDVASAADVQGHLSYLATENPKLVVDLGRVSFVDSAGCGALVATHRRCREEGGALRVCGVAAPVKTVFDLARINRVLAIYPTRAAAVAAFAADAAQ
jgi:anti-sigma B factor antagonist